MCHEINNVRKYRCGISVLPSVLIVYSGVLVGKVVVFGHGIAIDSAHGVFLLAVAFVLRRALFSSVILCVDVCCSAALRRALISSFCSAVKLFRLALSLALLAALISSFCSVVEMCSVVKLFRSALYLALLRALISSFCSDVKLFCRALLRSLSWLILSSKMFEIGCICSAITLSQHLFLIVILRRVIG